VQQLPKRNRLQHPAPKPPRPLPLPSILQTPYQPVRLANVPPKLESPESRVDGHADAQLLGRVHAEGETREGSTHGRRVGRGQGRGCAGVALPEGLDLWVEEVGAEAGEEAEEDAVEEEDAREREGEP
jgi:hypothetical protein